MQSLLMTFLNKERVNVLMQNKKKGSHWDLFFSEIFDFFIV
jgi:hypothetical protein